ncbi:hypothetical protein RQP46_006912 [Phenoliferia psychrophenolica]
MSVPLRIEGDTESDVAASDNKSLRKRLRKPRKLNTRSTIPSTFTLSSYLFDFDRDTPKAPKPWARSTKPAQIKAEVVPSIDEDDGEAIPTIIPAFSERRLRGRFFKTPLPPRLNKHTKDTYVLNVSAVYRTDSNSEKLPACLLDVAFDDRQAGLVVVGSATPHASGTKDRKEKQQQDITVHLYSSDLITLIADLDDLVLVTKLSKFRLVLPPADTSFANARFFLELLPIGRKEQIIGIGNTKIIKPSRADLEQVVEQFLALDLPPSHQVALDALELLDENPIALLLVRSLRKAHFLHPFVYDELIESATRAGLAEVIRTTKGHDPSLRHARVAIGEAVLKAKAATMDAWLKAEHDDDQNTYTRPIGNHSSSTILLDGDLQKILADAAPKPTPQTPRVIPPSAIRTYESATIDGTFYQAGDYALVSGDVSDDEAPAKARTRGSKGKGKKGRGPAKPPASGKMTLEHRSDEEEEALEGQKEDAERAQVVQGGRELWFARIVYFFLNEAGDGFFHAQWFEKGRDSQLLGQSSPLQLFLVKKCQDWPIESLVETVQVERIPRGGCFPSAPDRFYYSYMHEDGADIDAEAVEEAPLSNSTIFDQLGVLPCFSCDRKLSKALESRVVEAETPKELKAAYEASARRFDVSQWRYDDLIESKFRDERRLILSSIIEYGQRVNVLEGKFQLYHTSEWKIDYLHDTHRFHASSSLDSNVCRGNLKEDELLRARLFRNRQMWGEIPAGALEEIGVEQIEPCPACRAESDASDARSAQAATLPAGFLVDLYAGIGGLSLGLTQGCLGLAIESNPIALICVLRGMKLPPPPQPSHAVDLSHTALPDNFRTDSVKTTYEFSKYPSGCAPHAGVTLEPYEAEPFEPLQPIGFLEPTEYLSAPETTAQMWSRLTEHAIGSNWGISVVVTAHFTAGYASEVTSIRLCQVVENYEDIEDDARPSLPPYLAAMILADPDSAATLRKVGASYARAQADGQFTPSRTFHPIDGSHGPRIHYQDTRVFSFRELAVPPPVPRAIGSDLLRHVLLPEVDASNVEAPLMRLHELSNRFKSSSEAYYPNPPIKFALDPDGSPHGMDVDASPGASGEGRDTIAQDDVDPDDEAIVINDSEEESGHQMSIDEFRRRVESEGSEEELEEREQPEPLPDLDMTGFSTDSDSD